ncbi:MAG: hypothetical protein [Bacteriophage sp.]|nr:MAG: hypothetical protein [Bacteriophage sp.]
MQVKVRAIRMFSTAELGGLAAGDVAYVPDYIAKQLIKLKLVEPINFEEVITDDAGRLADSEINVVSENRQPTRKRIGGGSRKRRT